MNAWYSWMRGGLRTVPGGGSMVWLDVHRLGKGIRIFRPRLPRTLPKFRFPSVGSRLLAQALHDRRRLSKRHR